MRRVILLLLTLATALTATAQHNKWDHLDTLIGESQYSTAYLLAMKYFKTAFDNYRTASAVPSLEGYREAGGYVLTAAFYLTTLDYAYNKDAIDSAINRYSLLARRLQGVDRAVAYTFLFDSYSRYYSDHSWSIDHNKPSDDPNLKYPLWHRQRMVDSLMTYADSVLAYANQLRTTPTEPYQRIFHNDSSVRPPLDNTLLGMMVQTLLVAHFHQLHFNDMPADYRNNLLKPLPLYCQTPCPDTLTYPLSLYHNVAKLYLIENGELDYIPRPIGKHPLEVCSPSQEGTLPQSDNSQFSIFNSQFDIALWLDLLRYELLYYDSCFLPALDTLAQFYQPHLVTDEMKAMLSMYRAKYLNMSSQKVPAEQQCLETERLYPGTYGAQRCRLMRLYDICLPEYKIEYSNIESPTRSRMAYIETRNIPQLHFRIVQQIDIDTLTEQRKRDTLMSLTPLQEWVQPLPNAEDRRWHEYIIALPPMPQGNYYLLSYSEKSDNSDYSNYPGTPILNFQFSTFNSTDATFLTYSTPPTNGRHWITISSGHLVDRVTGQPIKGKRVTLHGEGELTEHNYHRRCRTDKQGFFHFSNKSFLGLIDYDQLSAQVDGYEHFYSSSYYGRRSVYTERLDRTGTKHLSIVMTDRPIYRLGDTVRFSCVAYRSRFSGKAQQQHLRPAKHVKLIATFGEDYDENDTLYLTTDKHGRCWGEFVIPADGRNGEYGLYVKSANYYDYWGYYDHYYDSKVITVEAYKPPHFMVTLSTKHDSATTETRRFGQPVTVYGTATSFSGAPMQGAKVEWEVSCEEMADPFQAHSVANDFPYSDSLTVGPDGTFQFTFVPEKDDNSARGSRPLFRRGANLQWMFADRLGYEKNSHLSTYIYTAYVRVTDPDGELHEQQLSFHVSEADGYCLLVGNDLSHLSFAYNNFDDQPLKGAVRVELQQLHQPDTVRTLDTLMKKHPRAKWIGSREEFQRRFPYRAFSREEGDRHSWPVVATRFSTTTTERTLAIPNLPSGLYRVRFDTPDGNHHDTLVNHVAPQGRVTGDDVVFLRTTPKKDWSSYSNRLTCRVGDTVRFELGSAYGNQPLYYRVIHAAKIYQRGMLILDSSRTTTLSIPITQKMKDGCIVQLSAIREGRPFATSYQIAVTQPDKILNVSTETFRDHLQPGEQEQWRFRITNSDSLGTAANLCMTLYDFSLEQYRHHDYGFWPWFTSYQAYSANIESPKLLTARPSTLNTQLSTLNSNLARPQLGFSLFDHTGYHKKLAFLFGYGIVRGTITDTRTREAVPFANIVVLSDGRQVKGTLSDMDGHFVIKDLLPGQYTLQIACVGYHKFTCPIVIDRESSIILEIPITPSATILECVEIKECRVPVIEIGAPESGMRMSADDIVRMPGTSVEEIVASVGGVGTARGEDGMVTLQGGVRKRAGIQVPKDAIAEIPATLNFDGSTSDVAPAMRKNLSTLAFFEPALRSDKDGRVSVTFTLPDALTQWQLGGFAWTDRYQIGAISRTVQSQKELMVQPLMPRFLRQGDTIEIRAKVSNLTDTTMTVNVHLEIESGDLENIPRPYGHPSQEGTAAAPSPLERGAAIAAGYVPKKLTLLPKTSSIASARFVIPDNWHIANYKVYAVKTSTTGGHHSDGEQGRLSVLSNRERITTSHLLYIPGSPDGKEITRTFDITLPASAPGDSTTLSFTPNPIHYVVEALPHFKRFLMPGPIYLANSIYVNQLTALLDTTSPKQQQHLKSRIKTDLDKLLHEQSYKGGWSWMPNGRQPSRYVTEAVMQRIANLPMANAKNYYIREALDYLDRLIVEEMEHYPSVSELSSLGRIFPTGCLSLLYTRSLYFGEKPLSTCDSTTQQAFRFFYNLYRMHLDEPVSLNYQGHLALLMLHMGDTADAVRLANRIKGTSHTTDDLGMYWRDNTSGYGWYQRPIETAALLVDVFADVLHDWESVCRIQQWILASKQGTAWRTDMATAAALQALLRQPTGQKMESGKVSIKLNNEELILDNNTPAPAVPSLEGCRDSGGVCILYFQLTNSSPLPAWGALFHSHDTHVDSIQYNGTGMKLRKTLSRVNADGSLTLLKPGDKLNVGDRVHVHIDIDCLRGFDNMVLRDQRAATFEPISTASGWQWNDGLHYYVDVRDEWTDCYIDNLQPDHYYMEYDLWVRHAGTFANGICTLQSVYAPEFRANTDSQTILVP
jgi:hypothetical protein